MNPCDKADAKVPEMKATLLCNLGRNLKESMGKEIDWSKHLKLGG